MVTESIAPPSAEAVTSPAARRFNIPGDQVKAAISDLPSDQAGLIWWYFGFCSKANLSRSELGETLKKPGGGGYYSHDSIIQLLTGGRIRRGENIDPLLDAIAALKKVEDARGSHVTSGFIQTRLAREIHGRCMKALHRQRITYVFGDSQIGKTESLLEVQRTNPPGQVVYVETPTGGNVTHFIYALAKQFAIPTKQGAKAGLRDRVIESFDSRMLLIVDEAHRCLRPGSISGLETFSFIRELWNRRKCGIVIALTNEGRDQFLHGPHAAQLAQLWRRRITPLQLPNVPPDDDAALFARAYGLPAAADDLVTIRVTIHDSAGREQTVNHADSPLRLQRHVLKTEGLGVWIGILQDASDMASEQKKAITWGAVLKAFCQAQADAEIYS